MQAARKTCGQMHFLFLPPTSIKNNCCARLWVSGFYLNISVATRKTWQQDVQHDRLDAALKPKSCETHWTRSTQPLLGFNGRKSAQTAPATVQLLTPPLLNTTIVSDWRWLFFLGTLALGESQGAWCLTTTQIKYYVGHSTSGDYQPYDFWQSVALRLLECNVWLWLLRCCASGCFCASISLAQKPLCIQCKQKGKQNLWE